ncbi:hypothetical protein K4K59_012376 [Colletotrichum sp. SAR11_240]|nr:hypothetical protein K4K59_012376 [Colletotrichum sp. SAR11_240]
MSSDGYEFHTNMRMVNLEHEKRVDVHIRNFLQELAPSASEDRSPDSWDDVLYRLMRSLRCHLGSNISPAGMHNYNIWLDNTNLTSSPADPYVDWLNIEKYYDSHEAETATQDVLAILEEMDGAAHRDGPRVTYFKPISLWYQNPVLCEFTNAHVTNPWTVSLPTDMETIARLVIPNFNGDISKTASIRTLISGYAGLKLHLCFEKDQSGLQPCEVVRLALNGSELAVINATAINLLKYCFATVLRWFGRICAEGKPLPGPGISKLRLKSIEEGTFYRLDLEKELWEAVRDFGVQRGRAAQRAKKDHLYSTPCVFNGRKSIAGSSGPEADNEAKTGAA